MEYQPRRRNTRQRRAIGTQMEQQNDFRSAQQIFEELRKNGESIGLATIYRTLQLMAEEGDLDMLRTDSGEVLYRKCASTDHHHHLVCRDCGRTQELDSDFHIESWVAAQAATYGYSRPTHSIELLGLCEVCTALETERANA